MLGASRHHSSLLFRGVRSNLASQITKRQIFREQADTASLLSSRWRSKLTSDQIFNIKRERGCWEQMRDRWRSHSIQRFQDPLEEEWDSQSFGRLHRLFSGTPCTIFCRSKNGVKFWIEAVTYREARVANILLSRKVRYSSKIII